MSILRQLLDAKAFEEDAIEEIDRVALLVRQAGLEHLVTEAGLTEVNAMIRAGAIVAKERAVILADVLADVPAALAAYDGGAAKRRQTLDWARSAPVELG